jgi:hypothetical protein
MIRWIKDRPGNYIADTGGGDWGLRVYRTVLYGETTWVVQDVDKHNAAPFEEHLRGTSGHVGYGRTLREAKKFAETYVAQRQGTMSSLMHAKLPRQF